MQATVLGDVSAKVAVNLNYIVDALKDHPGLVTIGIGNPSEPLTFSEHDRVYATVMPMFVQWQGPQAVPQPESQQPTEQLQEPSPAEPIPAEQEPAEQDPVPAPEAKTPANKRKGRKAV